MTRLQGSRLASEVWVLSELGFHSLAMTSWALKLGLGVVTLTCPRLTVLRNLPVLNRFFSLPGNWRWNKANSGQLLFLSLVNIALQVHYGALRSRTCGRTPGSRGCFDWWLFFCLELPIGELSTDSLAACLCDAGLWSRTRVGLVLVWTLWVDLGF